MYVTDGLALVTLISLAAAFMFWTKRLKVVRAQVPSAVKRLAPWYKNTHWAFLGILFLFHYSRQGLVINTLLGFGAVAIIFLAAKAADMAIAVAVRNLSLAYQLAASSAMLVVLAILLFVRTFVWSTGYQNLFLVLGTLAAVVLAMRLAVVCFSGNLRARDPLSLGDDLGFDNPTPPPSRPARAVQPGGRPVPVRPARTTVQPSVQPQARPPARTPVRRQPPVPIAGVEDEEDEHNGINEDADLASSAN